MAPKLPALDLGSHGMSLVPRVFFAFLRKTFSISLANACQWRQLLHVLLPMGSLLLAFGLIQLRCEGGRAQQSDHIP